MAHKERKDALYLKHGSLYLPAYGVDGSPSSGQVPQWVGSKLVFTTPSGAVPLASADDPPGSPNTENDEFTSATLDAKWTQSLTSAPSVDIHTTWPSRYYVNFTGSQTAQLRQAYAPAGDFSLTAKYHFTPGITGITVDLWAATSTRNDEVYTQYASSVPGIILLTKDNPTFNIRATDTVPLLEWSAVYLHLQRVGTTWSSWWSYDGWSFRRIGTHSKSMTVSQFFVRMINPASPPCRMGIDWVRRDWVTL